MLAVKFWLCQCILGCFRHFYCISVVDQGVLVTGTRSPCFSRCRDKCRMKESCQGYEFDSELRLCTLHDTVPMYVEEQGSTQCFAKKCAWRDTPVNPIPADFDSRAR